MYVCVCKKVTETDLKNSLNKSDGNLHACQKSLGFSTKCGRCKPSVETLLKTKNILPKKLKINRFQIHK